MNMAATHSLAGTFYSKKPSQSRIRFVVELSRPYARESAERAERRESRKGTARSDKTCSTTRGRKILIDASSNRKAPFYRTLCEAGPRWLGHSCVFQENSSYQ